MLIAIPLCMYVLTSQEAAKSTLTTFGPEAPGFIPSCWKQFVYSNDSEISIDYTGKLTLMHY